MRASFDDCLTITFLCADSTHQPIAAALQNRLVCGSIAVCREQKDVCSSSLPCRMSSATAFYAKVFGCCLVVRRSTDVLVLLQSCWVRGRHKCLVPCGPGREFELSTCR